MASSRSPSRRSPSRVNKSTQVALQPAQIPLPPSPPASDALLFDNPLLASSPHPAQSRRVSPRAKTSRPPPPTCLNNHPALKEVIESKLSFPSTSGRSRSKKRQCESQFNSSSPPTSPTNRKSNRPAKRLKPSSSSPQSNKSPPVSSTPDLRDSPNNPFLVKPGEKSRRAGSRRDDEHRKLVYVFRGKRIPYDTTEDLDHAGGSPFGSSVPKLLFPSPPTPGPTTKLKFAEPEEIEASSSSKSCTSPIRGTNPDRSQLSFQTPKRDKSKSNSAAASMLPTPQSRPRTTRPSKQAHPSHRSALAGIAKSGKTMATAMR